jgi:hypothetical protein
VFLNLLAAGFYGAVIVSILTDSGRLVVKVKDRKILFPQWHGIS